MSSRRPPERHQQLRAAPAAGSLLKVPNLLLMVLIIAAAGGLIAFLLLVENPFAPDTLVAAPTPTTTTVVTTDTTLPTSDTTLATTDTTVAVSSTTRVTTVSSGNIDDLQLALEPVAAGIPFPVFATSIPGDDRIFVLERQGRIRVIDSTGLLSEPFLDLTDRVGSGGIENGLLGLAFHPDYASNGRMFVYYTDVDLDSRLSEFSTAGLGADKVDRSTESILFEVDQTGIRHRAGMLEFGPDGNLWVALGDGGLGDQSAQDRSSLQGNILRIDVDNGDPYSIPAANPFTGTDDGRDEIWAYGLRNPWRFSIDFETRTIYIGDVGQADWEEINVASIDTTGLNFGWPNFEGVNCYTPSDGCGMTGWEEPTVAYSHEVGCSVTGGYVYRGTALPELIGHYFYADWCNGMVQSFVYGNGQVTDKHDWSTMLAGDGLVAAFGIDGNGEMLLVDSNGKINRIVRG